MQKYTEGIDSSEEKVLAYDLRQDYARLVGEHMRDIAEARKRNDYHSWFMALRDLYTLTKFKYDSDSTKAKFKELKDNVTSISNKYPTCFTGANKNAGQIERTAIDESLREFEEWIYVQMNEANMFGSKFADDEGL
jgi:hypothetical protein